MALNKDNWYNIPPELESDLRGRQEEYAFYGAGKTFVLENLIPDKNYGGGYKEKNFIDYYALHEHIEAQTGSHREACKAELGEVVKKESGFIEAYSKYLNEIAELELRYFGDEGAPDREYFGRAAPGFLTTERFKNSKPYQLLMDLKKELDE